MFWYKKAFLIKLYYYICIFIYVAFLSLYNFKTYYNYHHNMFCTTRYNCEINLTELNNAMIPGLTFLFMTK